MLQNTDRNKAGGNGDRVDGSLLFNVIDLSVLNANEDQPHRKESVENIH